MLPAKNPIPHLSAIVSLKQTTKVCIQQSNSEKDDKYNTESRRYSCIFTYGTNSGTGEVFHFRETFNTLINVSVSFTRRFVKISQSQRRAFSCFTRKRRRVFTGRQRPKTLTTSFGFTAQTRQLRQPRPAAAAAADQNSSKFGQWGR